jgi:hypothetical protein
LQLRRLASGQAELNPPEEHHGGGGAMATANLRHGDAGLLHLMHDRLCFRASLKWRRFDRPSTRGVKRYGRRTQLAALLN